MISRRDAGKLLAGAAAVGLSGCGVTAVFGSERTKPATRIVGAVRRDETIKRLPFYTANFAPTWASDGVQYFSVLESIDRNVPPKFTYYSRVFKFVGGPESFTIEDLPNYPPSPWTKGGKLAEFRGSSCLYVDGILYQLVFAPNHPYLREDGTFWPNFEYVRSKIIYSPDEGRSWRNQDGSPARWERWEELSSQNLLFYNTPDLPGPSAIGSFLQMGQNYSLNQDGYVYLYSSNGRADGLPNEVILRRAPKKRIMDRAAYEFFAGYRPDGSPSWTTDMGKRGVVHRYPFGQRSEGSVPGTVVTDTNWRQSVVFNPALSAYMLIASGGQGAKPSYLGIWISESPWGPFRQIHEETDWLPGGDLRTRAVEPQIPPKWISPDGKSFWLVWGDLGFVGPDDTFADKVFIEKQKQINDDITLAEYIYKFGKEYEPFTNFNMQKVDLVLS